MGFALGTDPTGAERRRLRHELAALRAVEALEEPPPGVDELIHLALIPTYTESLEKLRFTVRALAEAAWPVERKICAIITRETDTDGIANVDALRAEFGDAFAEFIHILDPLEPGIVVGKSSAMAWGGRYLYRLLVRERGMDPRRIIVTDLDADYRVHPQYFAYLSWVHLTDPNRETQLYQPVPYFHNNIWQVPVLQRLFAAVLTQMQMWRSVLPEKLQSFGSYSTTLFLVHDVGYWATDAIPEDSRFYWKSYFRYGDRFRAVPLFIPIYGDAVRARGYWRSMAEQYLQARRWAWGVTDIPYVVDNAVRHAEIPFWSRFWRIANLFGEHINWAIAPFVVMFGATVPLLINPAFAETTLGQNLPALRERDADPGARQPVRPRRGRASDRSAAARRVGLAPARDQLRAVDRAAVRRDPVQQPARPRCADAAPDRALPGVPRHREGLSRCPARTRRSPAFDSRARCRACWRSRPSGSSPASRRSPVDCCSCRARWAWWWRAPVPRWPCWRSLASRSR